MSDLNFTECSSNILSFLEVGLKSKTKIRALLQSLMYFIFSVLHIILDNAKATYRKWKGNH